MSVCAVECCWFEKLSQNIITKIWEQFHGWLMLDLHWQNLLVNMPATATVASYVLASLGKVTTYKNNLLGH